jgi:orotate phosphoribosyltransferase
MIYNRDIAGQIADFLLEIKAVILKPENPFRWASGWNSPIYCDNRILLSYPLVRDFVVDQFADVANNHFPDVDLIAGVATAGIPHGTLIADRLNKPLAYVRAKPKEHGTGKLIEGRIEPGQKVLVVEDLISTGKSSLQAVDAIREAGAEVVGMLAVFSYGFQVAADAFHEKNVKYISLSNYENLLHRAIEKGYVKEVDLHLLEEWRENPSEWKK